MRSIAVQFAVVLAVSELALVFFGEVSERSVAESAACAFLLVLLWWLGVAFHESGHALGARAAGLEVRRIGIGPLLLQQRDSKWRVSLCHGLPGASGYVCLAELDPSKPHWKRSYGLMLIAGPLSQTLFGLLVYAVAVSTAATFVALSATLVACAALQWISAFLSIVPMRIGLGRNDGAGFQLALRGGTSAKAYMQIVRWNDYLLSEDPPGSWPSEVVAAQEAALTPGVLAQPLDVELAIVAGYYLYFYYADRHEWAEANHVLTRAVELPRPAESSKQGGRFDLIDMLSAIHLSLRGRNALAAQAALDRIGTQSTIRKNSLMIGAKASIELAAQNDQKAIILASKAKRAVEKAEANVGVNRLEASWWDEVIVSARRALPAIGSVPDPWPKFGAPQPQLLMSMIERDLSSGIFAWDPGVASDVRTAWILRRPITDYDLTR